MLAITGLQLQPAKTKVWSPTPGVVSAHPYLRHLQATMSDIRGLTILGEAVGLEPEDAYPVGEEAYVTEQIQHIADKLCADNRKLRHLPGMCGDDQAASKQHGAYSKDRCHPGFCTCYALTPHISLMTFVSKFKRSSRRMSVIGFSIPFWMLINAPSQRCPLPVGDLLFPIYAARRL